MPKSLSLSVMSVDTFFGLPRLGSLVFWSSHSPFLSFCVESNTYFGMYIFYIENKYILVLL